MALPAGTALGPYRILDCIGTGGMGEVYLATDVRLNRDVAIKVPAAAFGDRFQREARVIAALNHPHICTIHDVGPDYLVMELVTGETLADRLRSGPLSIDEALATATQIAEALAAAHEKGIVHRDLKPGNIKIKPDGSVKVLDFGLAKTVGGDAISNSPTITGPATEAGLIIGTAAYMSPEQARGKAVDKRTDVWAFGCVLYQMLTGKPAFDGETLTDVLAAVTRNEPDWSALPHDTPPLLRLVLRRCLQKDPEQRVQDIRDARLEIEEAATGTGLELLGPKRSPRRWTAATPWVIALLFAAGALWLSARPRRGSPAANLPPVRLDLNLPEGLELFLSTTSVAFSPNGSVLALVGIAGGNRQAYQYHFARGEYVPIEGTEARPRCSTRQTASRWASSCPACCRECRSTMGSSPSWPPVPT